MGSDYGSGHSCGRSSGLTHSMFYSQVLCFAHNQNADHALSAP
ncbi:hypothetical protein [Anaerobiospirillum sp. NML120511]|nr:hypothetical protein [Anaerobiospirillum sp. NML120511]